MTVLYRRALQELSSLGFLRFGFRVQSLDCGVSGLVFGAWVSFDVESKGVCRVGYGSRLAKGLGLVGSWFQGSGITFRVSEVGA